MHVTDLDGRTDGHTDGHKDILPYPNCIVIKDFMTSHDYI